MYLISFNIPFWKDAINRPYPFICLSSIYYRNVLKVNHGDCFPETLEGFKIFRGQYVINCFMVWPFRMTHVSSLTPEDSLSIKMSVQIVYSIESAFEVLFLRMESTSWMTVIIKMEVEFVYPTYARVCPLARRQNVILGFADICNSAYRMLNLL